LTRAAGHAPSTDCFRGVNCGDSRRIPAEATVARVYTEFLRRGGMRLANLANLAMAVNLCACAMAHAHAAPPVKESASVLKVRVTTQTGARSYGSAVVIGPGKLVTNCHVVRNALHVELARGYELWTARLDAGSAERDLCVLAAPEVDAPPAVAGTAWALAPGDVVYAVGFPGGGPLVVSKGRVEALYAFKGARVIQTSAAFDPGASGGALFDEAGRLVGFLTFKAPAGGTFHFAVPVDWVATLKGTADAADAAQAFWEQVPEHRAHFLRAAWHEAREQWSELFAECQRWAANEPDNEAPVAKMVKAVERLLSAADRHPPKK